MAGLELNQDLWVMTLYAAIHHPAELPQTIVLFRSR